jgi:hypothetical protein
LKKKKNSISVVIAGHWNLHILTASWINTHIFKEQKLQVEFPLNIGLPHKYTATENKITLIPTEDKVTLIALEDTEECLNKLEDFTAILVTELPVTPASAFGVNLGYLEENPSQSLVETFSVTDNKQLSNYNFQEINISIARRLIVENRILNFRVALQSNQIEFDFNFHYDVSNIIEIKEKVKDQVLKNKTIAENMLKDVYKLTLETSKEK